jgi:hypothetical protein
MYVKARKYNGNRPITMSGMSLAILGHPPTLIVQHCRAIFGKQLVRASFHILAQGYSASKRMCFSSQRAKFGGMRD